MKTGPKLTVTVNNESRVFNMHWEAEAVSVGSDWVAGLAMADSEYFALQAFLGDDYLADVPMYCYNEGGDISGTFENSDEVAFGMWKIDL